MKEVQVKSSFLSQIDYQGNINCTRSSIKSTSLSFFFIKNIFTDTMYLNTRSTSKTNRTDLTLRIKFGILLSLQIPSVLCYLFLLFHLLFKRSMRRSLNNHVFIVLLFIGLIWNFLDLFLYSLTNVLMLWASIERHILIFHKSILNIQRKRFIIHYLPLIILPPPLSASSLYPDHIRIPM
jgi:hypothetical protein